MTENVNDMTGIATVYQTKGKTHDIALTARETFAVERNSQKLYPCAHESGALISLATGVRMSDLKFDCNVLRLQLLIRERIARVNLATLRQQLNDIKVSFDICEFMRLIGYSDDEVADSTKKANITRKVNSALVMLQQLIFKIKRGRNYIQFSIVSSVVKQGDTFTMKITSEYLQLIVNAAQYTKKGITRYTRGLFSRFSRGIYRLSHCEEMIVMFNLDAHYSMNSNRRRMLHNRISVGSLAESLSLPCSSELVRRRNSTNYYRDMIKPVIDALEKLSSKGLIQYALYETGCKEPVRDARIRELKHNPEQFLNVVVRFECLEQENAVES